MEQTTDVPNMGCHLILDFHNTSVDMNDFEDLNKNFTRIILNSGATIEDTMYKRFEPFGVSILYLLSESHFSIHTWPEYGACAIDFYHCGETARERMIKAEELLCEYLGWENCTGSMIVDRGNYNYALIAQDEHSSILFKKHKLVDRIKTENGETRVYNNEQSGKILAVDGAIQMGFHNISNLGSLFDEERNIVLRKESFDEYYNKKTKKSTMSVSTTTTNQIQEKEEDKNSSKISSSYDEKDISTEEKSSKHVLIIGNGDLSLPCQMISQELAEYVTVLDGDSHHEERVKTLVENNAPLERIINENKIKFVASCDEINQKEKFDGIIVINKRFKPERCVNYLKKGGYYSEVVFKESEFYNVCKLESLCSISFHDVSNTITRFLIGKARYS